MKLKTVFSTIAVIMGTMLAQFAVPAHAETITLRLGTGTPPSHVWTRAAEYFAEKANEISDGEIEIAVFPAAQLGPESDMLQQMQANVLDMGVISAAATSARSPSFLAWFSPFAMKDVEATVIASRTETAREILDQLDELGIKGLGYVFAGMRHILTADTAVSTLADLENQKIRITPFPGMQVWWQAAGAVPTPVQLGDVYQSLDSGLLDGVDIDLDALAGFSMQQVADHLIVTSHMAFPGVAMISQSAWERIGSERQDALNEAMSVTLEWAAQQQIANEENLLARLESEINVTRLENAQEIFAEANAAFNEAFSDIPLVSRFQAELAR